MNLKTRLHFFLIPVVASLIFNILSLIYFVHHYGGLNNFLAVNKQINGEILIFIVIFLVAITASVITSTLTMFLMLTRFESK